MAVIGNRKLKMQRNTTVCVAMRAPTVRSLECSNGADASPKSRVLSEGSKAPKHGVCELGNRVLRSVRSFLLSGGVGF